MAYDTNSNIDNIFQHIKYQNGKIITQRQELSECYKYGNATEGRVEELLSYDKDDLAEHKLQNHLNTLQEENNPCQNNGWLIDNIFCPISNKMNEFWKPLPTWGKDAAVVTIALTGAILTIYSLLPTSFRTEYVHLLEKSFKAMSKDPCTAEALIKTFNSLSEDMTPQEMAGLATHFIESSI